VQVARVTDARRYDERGERNRVDCTRVTEDSIEPHGMRRLLGRGGFEDDDGNETTRAGGVIRVAGMPGDCGVPKFLALVTRDRALDE
jgi:hypothetical protein